MTNPLISVVVPVYKVERYLDQCVESLLAQSYSNLEIILVDDGSPDSCPKRCDQWRKADSRIHVIHQANAGLGPARNSGLATAKGEYVAFLDSDDWVKPEMIQKLYEAARLQQADIAVGGYTEMNQGRAVRKMQHPYAGRTLSQPEEIQKTQRKLYGHAPDEKEIEAFPMSACMSLYRRAFLEENQLRFRNLISEDTIFNLSAYRRARLIVFTDGVDYCYRKDGQASITRNFDEGKKQKYLQFLTVLNEMASKEEDTECRLRAKKTVIDHYRMYVEIVAYSTLPLRKKLDYIEEYAEMQELRALWAGYPTKNLPIQQRVFHCCMMHGCYGTALLLNHIRQMMKKWERRERNE